MENVSMELIREIKIWWIEFAVFVTLVIGIMSVVSYKLENDYKYQQRVKKKARKIRKTINDIVDMYIEDIEDVA